jgi:putative membrane protein
VSSFTPAGAKPNFRFVDGRRWLRRDAADLFAYVGIFGMGGVLSWLCRIHPGLLPAWAPWDFSWAEFLATALPLWWFLRGLAQTPSSQRPPAWRRFSFLFGLAAIYAVLQTHFDYRAQHMFFLNRVQHVVMHHIGPFLIGLGGVGATLRRGMPLLIRHLIDSRPVAVMMRILQQPVIAVVLFVGLFYLWLIPAVHFRAMIDPHLYALMNWSMVLDGLLFWTVVLDLRPQPPARLSFGARAGMAFATTFPAIIIGYYLTSVDYDLYPSYALCGRLFPSITAITDQRIGGVIIWVLPTMMGITATMIVLRAFLRHNEEALAIAEQEAGGR